MTASSVASSRWRSSLWILSLALASVLLTLGFACALPLAAFATIAAITFDRREALIATTAVWLANQAAGFAFLHYPMDGVTLAWGGALGVITLLSCETARFTTRRIAAVAGVCAAFLAAFIVYQGSLIVIDMVIGQSGDELAFATVARIFLINACAFGGLWALKIVASTMSFGRKVATALAPRHV
jgi:hypothetical protein